jgi:hypothetical protein
MQARQLIENAAYGPETLTVLFQAFDAAWEDIACNYGNNPSAVEAARTNLATIILGMACEGRGDPVAIKNAALQAMGLSLASGLR